MPNLSQVSDLYITPTGATDAFTYGGGNPTATSGGIDNTVVDNSKTKWVVGKGGVPEPEESVYNGPKSTRIVFKRRYQLSFEVNVKEDGMRDLLRNLQCGWDQFTFRYGTQGGYLYGGSAGIKPTFVNAQLPLADGDEDNEIGRIILDFETTNGDPPRDPNPLAS